MQYTEIYAIINSIYRVICNHAIYRVIGNNITIP